MRIVKSDQSLYFKSLKFNPTRDIGVSETSGITQYEVEAQKGGKREVLDLRVSVVRSPRGLKKLLGEAYVKTPTVPMIYFKITNATSEEGVFNDFLRLLLYRGYLPLRFRTFLVDGRKSKWDQVSLEGMDAKTVIEHERSASVEE